LSAEGYDVPTPIQVHAIPPLLEGRDLLGCAQTGTGKTAAFALPILQRLTLVPPPRPRVIRALVLSPTRELASQIEERFRAYGKNLNLRSTVIFGGVGQMPQVERLRAGIDILVATPGRLLDLLGQREVNLAHLGCFVLDEADRMLDMGFIHDVRKVIAVLPRQRQSLFFSATMPPDIEALAATILTRPVRVAVTPVASTAERVLQSVCFVEKGDKPALLERTLRNPDYSRVLVFTRTKHGANKVAKYLTGAGIHAEAIHGNKSQSARETALANFKSGRTRVLVATDIAARGIDVDAVSHVINFDLPNEPESYVHRIGRTARAGADGTALSFCSAEERPYLRDIERLIQMRVPVSGEVPATARPPASEPRPTPAAAPPPHRSQPRHPPRTHHQSAPAAGRHPAPAPAHRPARPAASSSAGLSSRAEALLERGAASAPAGGPPRRRHFGPSRPR
jgi:ATP-dependent RNA helicase RhlE